MASLAEKSRALQRGESVSRRRRVLFLSLVLAVAALSGCGNGLIKSLADVARLREQIINEFHDSDVQVVIQNSTVLNVTFINSPLNDESSGPKRMARAQETAAFVKHHYGAIDRIEKLWVAFAEVETHFLIVTYSKVVDMFPFDSKGTMLGVPAQYAPEFQTEGEDQAQAVYNTARDETDVHITRLQLSGNLDEGLALAPHFAVHGHLADGHATTAAVSVVFDFASFAPQKIFKADAPIAIIADGKTIFAGKARNSSTETEGGNEFLSQEIPFDQFSEMTRAEKIELKLADAAYVLTNPQLVQLRKMTSYGTPKH